MFALRSTIWVVWASLLVLVSPLAFSDNYVAGANYSNGQVYALCFDQDTGTAIRSTTSADGGTKPASLTFFTGNSNELGKDQLQLFVADESGQIRRFLWGEEFTVGEEPQKDCSTIVIEPTVQLYSKNDGTGPTAPNGLVVAPEQQLVTLSSANGGTESSIWRFDLQQSPVTAPQSLLPELVIAALPFGELNESLVLPQNMASTALHSDLLVATTSPAAIIKIDSKCLAPGASPCGTADWQELIGGSGSVPLAADPAGIALLPSPHQDILLVSTRSGDVAVYNLSSGQAVLDNPALISGLGQGKFKIKTARKVDIDIEQNSRVITFAANLYVAGRNNGSVVQIGLEMVEGNLELSSDPVLTVNQGIEHPRGLATTSEDFIRIFGCTENCPDEILVDISTVIEHSFDVSAQTGEPISGYIGETVEVFKDERPACQGLNSTAAPQPLYIWNNQLYTYDPDPVTPTDPVSTSVMIPSQYCGSPANDPHILLIRTISNIDPTLTDIKHRAYDTDLDEDGVADLDCTSGDASQFPAVGWAPIPETNDPPIVEGQTMIDVITGCGSLRLRTRTMSYFIPNLRVRPVASATKGKGKPGKQNFTSFGPILIAEYDGLQRTLEEANLTSGCIVSTPTLEEVYTSISDIQSDIERGRTRTLQSDTMALFEVLRNNELMISPKGLGCPLNYQGDVKSRITHLYFSTATKLLGQTWVEGCNEENLIELCLQ
ncbi:hypothetical protein DXV75_00020 [Alteromonas aestuariivivens]|uniref:Uncharacterized protein n=1 Tax=Alteromonas aestuariivivens TaxID=1938339 RepID=A0A3D8MEF4_9ALTE|nr:hypothetical protein [Alteromonas aestuariivivens]RDV28894.1 hypothetical protein DXV75_00020 [Alteromonas aestuariivivens]